MMAMMLMNMTTMTMKVRMTCAMTVMMFMSRRMTDSNDMSM